MKGIVGGLLVFIDGDDAEFISSLFAETFSKEENIKTAVIRSLSASNDMLYDIKELLTEKTVVFIPRYLKIIIDNYDKFYKKLLSELFNDDIGYNLCIYLNNCSSFKQYENFIKTNLNCHIHNCDSMSFNLNYNGIFNTLKPYYESAEKCDTDGVRYQNIYVIGEEL